MENWKKGKLEWSLDEKFEFPISLKISECYIKHSWAEKKTKIWSKKIQITKKYRFGVESSNTEIRTPSIDSVDSKRNIVQNKTHPYFAISVKKISFIGILRAENGKFAAKYRTWSFIELSDWRSRYMSSCVSWSLWQVKFRQHTPVALSMLHRAWHSLKSGSSIFCFLVRIVS